MPYFGKYRGQVIDNADPLMMARIQATVSGLGLAVLGWAMPCSPYAGSGVGLVTVPPIGANVWVEFEGGDVDYPIWSGCFWGPGELPAEAAVGTPDRVQVLKSDGFLLKASSAGPNEFVIEVSPPLTEITLSIILNDEGIVLRNSAGVSVKLEPDTLSLHNDEVGSIILKPEAIEILASDSTVEITPEQISLTSEGNAVSLDSDGVHVEAGASVIDVTPGEIEISNEGSTIVVSPGEVDVNNGALNVR